MATNQRTIKGLTVEYNGNTIDNVTSLYIDAYSKGKVGFTYLENESTTVNVNCALKDVKINIA